jgi:hypothetical protein
MISEEVFGFTLPIFTMLVPGTDNQRSQQRDSTKNRMSFEMSMVSRQPFNPFSQRSKNIKVRWFEADLDAFYAFVENQPLLTADQELQYGKAMRMWVQVEQMRTHMSQDNSSGSVVTVTDDELAAVIGVDTLRSLRLG